MASMKLYFGIPGRPGGHWEGDKPSSGWIFSDFSCQLDWQSIGKTNYFKQAVKNQTAINGHTFKII